MTNASVSRLYCLCCLEVDCIKHDKNCSVELFINMQKLTDGQFSNTRAEQKKIKEN